MDVSLDLKNIKHTRKEVDKIFDELGCYQRKAYRMSRESFQKLHDELLWFTVGVELGSPLPSLF